MSNVTFTPQLMTVIIEHEHLIDSTLHQQCDLSTSDYCILRTLYLIGGPVSGISFIGFLLLKANSISVAIKKLEQRGLVSRKPDANDARTMVTSITSDGIALVRQATSMTFDVLKETFWRDFSEEEIARGVGTARPIMDYFGADTACLPDTSTTGHTPLLPEFIVGLKHIVQRWGSTLASLETGLAISDYRILQLLDESREGMRPSGIAKCLLLSPSAVTSFKTGLIGRKLVSSSKARGRHATILTCTDRGHELVERATDALSKATSELYSHLDEDTARWLDGWHMQMYRLLMSSARFLR